MDDGEAEESGSYEDHEVGHEAEVSRLPPPVAVLALPWGVLVLLVLLMLLVLLTGFARGCEGGELGSAPVTEGDGAVQGFDGHCTCGPLACAGLALLRLPLCI